MQVDGLDEVTLRRLMERFYDRVRGDDLLGPVFDGAIADWGDHHRRLADFWSSVMLTTGRYKGNPLALHLRLSDALTPEAFERWLSLWRLTTQDLLPAELAGAMQAKAARIAESFQLAIQHRRVAAA